MIVLMHSYFENTDISVLLPYVWDSVMWFPSSSVYLANNAKFYLTSFTLSCSHNAGSQDRSVGKATGYELEGRSFDSRQGQVILLCSTAYRPVLGPTQPPVQWVLGAVSPGVKRPLREADHSPRSSAEVKNGGVIPPLPHTSSWCGA
jgi:hypothetical protein